MQLGLAENAGAGALSIIATVLLVLGALFLFTGVGIFLGLGLIAAGVFLLARRKGVRQG